jgi:hypothetical protein
MLQGEVSAFVTGGAVFGIKLVGRDDEHVVALDADAVENRTDDRAGLAGVFQAYGRLVRGLLRNSFAGHGEIIACRSRRPTEGGLHPLGTSSASSLCGNYRIHERLSHEPSEHSSRLGWARHVEKAALLLLK